MTTTNNQNTARKKLPVNSETLKMSEITEPPVQDSLVTQIRTCFENSRLKHKKLRNDSGRDKPQIQEKRKIGEVSSVESSEDDQFSYRNDDNEVDYLSLPSENEMDRKIRELHGSLQDSSDKESPIKDYTKVLKDAGKKEWANK